MIFIFILCSLTLTTIDQSPVNAVSLWILPSDEAAGQATDASLDDFVITVKTDNPGTSSDIQFTIPTSGIEYDYNVDCDNDGTNDITGATDDTTCNYATAGTYTVRIKDNTGAGTGFPQIYFDDSGDKDKLLTIEQWGTGNWISMNSAFKGCSNLTTINATDIPNVSGVSDMQWMFAYARVFNGNLNGWDTSQVTNMTAMFFGAYAFNGNISGWDTGQVTNMTAMFWGAKAFNQDIGDWDTSHVTNMYEMFGAASAFNQDIGDWDTSRVQRMRSMFLGASAFDQNLSKWNVGALTSAEGMFLGVKLSIANYDALLQGWAEQTLQPNVTFSGGDSQFCVSEAARNLIISTYTWTITDGGKYCPVPILTSLNPTSIQTGSSNQTLTVSGSCFVPDSVVRWNDIDLTTTYVSPTQLSALIPESLLVNAQIVQVTVFTPPPGGGTSSSLAFTIYNPINGSGWINSPAGAYLPDPSLSGKAIFNFVVRDNKGVNIPKDNIKFQFKAGDLKFTGTSYEWLVIAENNAQFTGEGTINGEGCYKYLISAVDGSPDTLHIKICIDESGNEVMIYDNGSQQALGGGNIVIHEN